MTFDLDTESGWEWRNTMHALQYLPEGAKQRRNITLAKGATQGVL